MKSRLVKELMEQRLYIAGLGLVWLAMPLNELLLPARLAAQWLLFHMIAVGAFSSEFHHGTATFQLAQPIPRAELWSEKSFIAFAIMLSTVVAEYLGLAWAPAGHLASIPSEAFAVAPCGALLALGGGCLFGVTIRRTFTGLLAALLAPAVVATLLIGSALAFVSDDLVGTEITRRGADIFGPAGVFVFLAFIWFAITFPLGWIAFKRMEV